MIDDAQATVIVPYDDEAKRLLDRMEKAERPGAADFRRLQQYAVSIPKQVRDEWLAAGVLRAVNAGIGEGLLRFEDCAHYREETGVDLKYSVQRESEYNII